MVTGLGTPRADFVAYSLIGQNFYLNNGVLIVHGDQLGANYNDTVTIGPTVSGGVQVTLNGMKAQFNPGTVTRVNVSTLGGNNTITIDDSLDMRAQTVDITQNSVHFSGLPMITYFGHVTSLNVYGGSGNCRYNVLSTSVSAQLTLLPGTGPNDIMIGNNDSLAGIAGPISVNGYGLAGHAGQDELDIDDSSDSGRNLSLSDHSVEFTGGPPIYYFGMSSVNLVGTPGSVISVDSVPSGTAITIYYSGTVSVTGPARSKVTLNPLWPWWETPIVVNASTWHLRNVSLVYGE
jgi:hypothetical protein